MGEYARLNEMLRREQQQYDMIEQKPNKTEEDILDMADLSQSIGEIRGTLFEMAESDGYEDVYMALDY